MRDEASIRDLARPDFLATVGDLTGVYAAAMGAAPAELPARRVIMERHAGNPSFRAVAATAGKPRHIVAFAYGFRGAPGQWWHDVVRAGLVAKAGPAAASAWLDDVMEIAEVHVHPHYQARGIGGEMLRHLTSGRNERVAVLSTRDAPTRARRLYRRLGFAELLTEFEFPGGGPLYAVMGAVLPLRQQQDERSGGPA
ncbi:MAG: GNAT family N-acetyltransferase [Streptosporangiaceae bacterium]